MRTLTHLLFDDIIVGTGTTWYTPASYNDSLGALDSLALMAVTTGVTGTSPTLTCQIEASGDGMSWVNYDAAAEINAVGISNEFIVGAAVTRLFLHFVRVRMTLGGTTPQCRLKLSACGRVSSAHAQPQAPVSFDPAARMG